MKELEALLDTVVHKGCSFSLYVVRGPTAPEPLTGWPGRRATQAGSLWFVVTFRNGRPTPESPEWPAKFHEAHEDDITDAATKILGGEWIVSRFHQTGEAHGHSGAAWVVPLCRGCGETITGGLCGSRCWGGGVCLLPEGHTMKNCGTNDHVGLCAACLWKVVAEVPGQEAQPKERTDEGSCEDA